MLIRTQRSICVNSLMLVIALALPLAGCQRVSPAPPVALRICYYETQDFLPYFVMQEQGFASKNGLRFIESGFPGGAAALDAMAAGTIDLCPSVGIVPLFIAAERGLVPGKAVAVAANNFADPQHRGGAVLVAKDVKGWKDLEGKKVGSNARNSIIGAALRARLKLEDVTTDSFVEIPFANLGLALGGGNIAAASMSEPHITQSLLRGDGQLLDWVVGGPPLERTEFTAIVFSAEFHRRNPLGVKAFLRAHLAAVRWINEHSEAARAILAKRMSLGADVARKINLLNWPTDARSDSEQLAQTGQVLLRAGLIQGPIDTHHLHDQSLLDEVLKEPK